MKRWMASRWFSAFWKRNKFKGGRRLSTVSTGDDVLSTLAEACVVQGAAVQAAGRITFHAVGDTGSSDVCKYRDEVRVADQLASDAHTPRSVHR